MSAIDPVKLARYARLAKIVRKMAEERQNQKKEPDGHPSDKTKLEAEKKKTEPREEVRTAKRKYWRRVGAVSALR